MRGFFTFLLILALGYGDYYFFNQWQEVKHELSDVREEFRNYKYEQEHLPYDELMKKMAAIEKNNCENLIEYSISKPSHYDNEVRLYVRNNAKAATFSKFKIVAKLAVEENDDIVIKEEIYPVELEVGPGESNYILMFIIPKTLPGLPLNLFLANKYNGAVCEALHIFSVCELAVNFRQLHIFCFCPAIA